eukprot:SAG11_NODE_413_length_9694_cov_2.695675_6_plen_139_part_00
MCATHTSWRQIRNWRLMDSAERPSSFSFYPLPGPKPKNDKEHSIHPSVVLCLIGSEISALYHSVFRFARLPARVWLVQGTKGEIVLDGSFEGGLRLFTSETPPVRPPLPIFAFVTKCNMNGGELNCHSLHAGGSLCRE